ncbi:MAG TPA: hypothetical protein VM618_02930 [Acidimicrobiia bacterium]|nr:hypothetical protein [Acidimicrobiia bacterium]
MRRTTFGRGVLAAMVVTTGLVATSPASAQTAFPGAPFSGYATGTVLHADAIEDAGSGTRLVDVEEAFSGAGVDSGGLEEVVNEVDRVVVPAQGTKHSYGRGSGLEIGAGVTPADENQLVLAEKAEAAAPENTDLVTQEIGPVPGDPLAYASALRGEAQARWNPATCVLGSDLSYGLGYAADVELLDQDATPDGGGDTESLEEPVVAANAPEPDRRVAQSVSRTRLVPQISEDGTVEGAALGLMSETRMTIAPVTLGGQVTIEFLGEWVLRAVATGHSGYVHYGPGEVSPSTPVLRLIDQATQEVTDVVRAQDLFGDEGLVIPIPELGIELAIGEDPRAIGGDAETSPTETPTLVSAAVDVVRIRLLDVPDTFSLADLRIGHMEVEAAVPAGGITCPIPVTKAADRDPVAPGETFTYTITVENPFDCTLRNVAVTDTVSTRDAAQFEITGASDGGVVNGSQVTWSDVGPIEPGASKAVTLQVAVPAGSGAGVIVDDVSVTATCGLGTADGSTDVPVSLSGGAHLEAPQVVPTEVAGKTAVQAAPDEPRTLPRTGGHAALGLIGLALAGLGGLARRRFV